MEYKISPIGHIKTPFTQKFGIPRQGLGLSIATGRIVFDQSIRPHEACEGLSEFSHLWLLFLFSEHLDHLPKQRIRPPRLGGNTKLGVFASRSSFRPNNIGMTLVKNLGMHGEVLEVEGVDMLNNTPIVDIKPYIVYADSMPTADSSYATAAPESPLEVFIPPQLVSAAKEKNLPINLIIQVLSQDPRPAYKKTKNDPKFYTIQLYNIDIHWRVDGSTVVVCDIN
ncbi:tRNA (N6-threonylcarbamoyladenosine(37)-N6)-methyltransferase TrmO [Agaribacter flavus]|uniref:tRNA (N6-threonylcarbamoyladenosine(37)-N6)-methyltransferase TrmO n=1 Tax=Agaribacter flavus TaxID=1902781 RepID=A0ABV7FUJ8_9ALTE